jgi:circadian clock protein KaiB
MPKITKNAPPGKVLPFGRPPEADPESRYMLKLYITGATGRSLRAIENIKAVCEEHLKENYRLEVIDLYQQPELAMSEQIIAAPTLVKEAPLPTRKFIGDLSNTDRILTGLSIVAKP